MSNQNISSENPFASQAGFDPTAAPQQQGQSQQQDPWSQAQPQQDQSQQSGGQDPWSQAQQGQDQQAQPQQDQAPQSDNQAPQFQSPQSQQEQQNGQGGFQGQQPDNQAPQFLSPQDQGQQNQGGFQNQQNGFQQNQGGFQNQQNGFQNQGGFQNQQNGFQNQGGFQNQQNGFQNQGGFQGQPQQQAGETITASGPAVVDLNNPDQYMYQANQDRGDIRKEGDAILLMVPTKIEYDVPSKYGNGSDTYNRCVLDFLVVTGPNQGTVYRDSMNFNSYIIYSMQDALKRNIPIVGKVQKKPTKKAPNGAWMVETVEDKNIWHQAVQMGIQAGLLRGA